VDARRSTKRDTTWNGSKVHLTETCDPDGPHLITDVQTTPATTADGGITPTMHTALAAGGLLPAAPDGERADPDAATLVTSRATDAIDLVGPVHRATSWQAQAGQGFELAGFAVDWDAEPVVWPQGQVRRGWSPSQDGHGNALIHIPFERTVCGACAQRAACTQAHSGPRTLKLRPQAQHEALQAARQRQTTEACKQRYRLRAGGEGAIAQGVQVGDVRAARYRGLAKTALQHLVTALALNLIRLVAWWDERPRAQTRQSRFTAALKATAPPMMVCR